MMYVPSSLYVCIAYACMTETIGISEGGDAFYPTYKNAYFNRMFC